MYAEIYQKPRHYSKLTPPRVSAAEARARELYRAYDRLVDRAVDSGAATRDETGLAGAIDDAWQEYKQADEYAAMLRRQYHADPISARWFEVQNG